MWIRYIAEGFMGPTAVWGWLISILSIIIPIAIPIMLIINKNLISRIIALFLVLVPTILGGIAFLKGYMLTLQAISLMPETQIESQTAMGILASLSSLFFGLILSTKFIIIFIFILFISSHLLKRTDKLKNDNFGTNIIKLNNLFISVFTPILGLWIGTIGLIFGIIMKNDAITNAPSAQRETIIYQSEIITRNSIFLGSTIFIILSIISIIFYRSQSKKG